MQSSSITTQFTTLNGSKVAPKITYASHEVIAIDLSVLQTNSLTTAFTASQSLLLLLPNLFKFSGEVTPYVIHMAARSAAARRDLYGYRKSFQAAIAHSLSSGAIFTKAGATRCEHALAPIPITGKFGQTVMNTFRR